MAKVKKVEGFNSMEQALLEKLSDGEAHSIRELKELFWTAAKKHCKSVWESPGQAEFDAQAQSFVRNSIRRLVRDGWAEGPHMNENLPRGHYKLTKLGRERVRNGVAITPSAKKEKKVAKKASTKKKVAKKATAKKASTKKAKAKKTPQEIAAKHRASSKKKATEKKPKKPPQKAKASKGNGVSKTKRKPAMLQKALDEAKEGVKKKAEETKAKAAKESAKEKAQAAQRRAAEEATAA